MFDFLTAIPLIGGTLSVFLPFLIVLSIVIFVHEYGHYIVGRWCGIHAEAFSMGFGRVLKSWVDKHGTKWQIAALPFGGYVKFLGDANAASAGVDEGKLATLPDHLKDKTFHAAALWKKALTVFAGPGTNFVFSIVVFAAMAMATGVANEKTIVGEVRQFPGVTNELQEGDLIRAINDLPIASWADFDDFKSDEAVNGTFYTVERDGQTRTVEGPFPWLPIVAGVNPVTPAAKAGLKAGDLIVEVGNTKVTTFPQLQEIVRGLSATQIPIVVLRGQERLQLQLTPRAMPYEKEDGTFGERIMIGIGGTVSITPQINSIGPIDAVYYGGATVVRIVQSWLRTIRELVTGGLSVDNLQGPVGIAVASGDSAAQGFTDFIFLIGFISTAIGLMNLLPIPILDGGHLAIFAYQAVFRREPNEKVLHYAMAVGMSLLLMLMVYATFNDILRLFS